MTRCSQFAMSYTRHGLYLPRGSHSLLLSVGDGGSSRSRVPGLGIFSSVLTMLLARLPCIRTGSSLLIEAQWLLRITVDKSTVKPLAQGLHLLSHMKNRYQVGAKTDVEISSVDAEKNHGIRCNFTSKCPVIVDLLYCFPLVWVPHMTARNCWEGTRSSYCCEV